MNKSVFCLAIVGLAGAAFAQTPTTPERPVGVGLRFGVFMPTNDTTRDTLGDTSFAFGATYRLTNVGVKTSDPAYRAELGLSVDFYGKNGVSNVPILLNYVGHRNQLFYSAGAGIGFAQLPGDNKGRFAYGLGVGYEFATTATTPFFVEARFMGADKSELNGFGLYAGIRL